MAMLGRARDFVALRLLPLKLCLLTSRDVPYAVL